MTEPNTPGELFVRSASMFDTYYKAEDKYEEDRRGDYHTVGDIAYRDDEGYYYICDRKKDMIITGGMNVYPAEVEAALEQHPGIFDVAVFGIPSEEWGETVHAVVVPEPGHAGLSERGRDGLRPPPSGRVQDPEVGQLRGRAAAHRFGQGAQAGAAGPVLGSVGSRCGRPDPAGA